LYTELWQSDVLNKRFEISRHIYNSLVTVTQKRYNEMIKTKVYRLNYAELTEVNKEIEKVNKHKKSTETELKIWNDKKKQIYDTLNDLRTQYGLNEYSFHADVKNIQKHFKTNIDSFTAQKIATTLWRSYKELIFGDGENVHYKRYGSLNSLEGKSNKTGIRFVNGKLSWLGLEMPVIIDYKNQYETQALENEISYCRIVRKYVRNKYKFYVQIVFKGAAPIKVNSETGKIKCFLGNGDVGLDIGTRTLAIASNSDVRILELADRMQNIETQQRFLLRKQDRSRRATNPGNYNPDGTIKNQGNKKVIWNKSNHYIENQNRLKELYRKQADVRKLQHEILANEILELGDNIYVETMNYAGLQKRAKKTEKNDRGKFKKKKRFGKSLANKAPAMLLDIIDRKLQKYGRQLIKIDTWSVKASQYNHAENSYKKKQLSERWNDIDGHKIQRDMYSAFLIMNVNEDLKSVDKVKCTDRFENFLTLHDKEVERLIGNKNLSSIAI